jgi:hypothetical protein
MVLEVPNTSGESAPAASKVELSSAEIAFIDNKSMTDIIRTNNNLLPNFLIFSPPLCQLKNHSNITKYPL